MAAGIGGVACDFVRGQAKKLQERTEVWQVPGHDSFGVQALGLGLSGTQIIAVKFGSNAEIETWYDNLIAVVGQLGTFENDFGVTSPAVLFQELSEPQKSVALFEGGVRAQVSVKILGV